jgi:hypothetical protein
VMMIIKIIIIIIIITAEIKVIAKSEGRGLDT